jgi:hypothetical protein
VPNSIFFIEELVGEGKPVKFSQERWAKIAGYCDVGRTCGEEINMNFKIDMERKCCFGDICPSTSYQ